jgi:hypothetical protein
MKAMINETTVCGAVGTAVGAFGASLSVTEIQAIVSIIITVLGFVISVLIPLVIKIVKWYKNAKKDGNIDKEELDDLQQIVQDGAKDVKEGAEEIKKQVKHKNAGDE